MERSYTTFVSFFFFGCRRLLSQGKTYTEKKKHRGKYLMFGWFRKKEAAAEEAPPRTDLVPIPRAVPIPDGAECFFDPFDLEVRRRSLDRLPKYLGVEVNLADVHAVAEEEKPQEGEEKPAEVWNDDETPAGTTRASNNDAQTPVASGAVMAPRSASSEPIPDDDALAELIQKEKAAVAELRALLQMEEPTADQDRHRENLTLLRFLRAREYVVKDAAEMYQKQVKWRSDNKIDSILETPDPLEAMFQCICGHRNHGYSYEGHPVYYERTGLVRVAEMLKYCSEEDIINRHTRHMEYAMRRCMHSSMANKRNVEKIIMIHDLAHLKFTVETVGVKIFTKTVTIDQQMYPERLHRVFIINAPLSFRGVWAVVKPFIDPKTSRKIKILGSNFQASLLKEIPLSELPEMYGGNCRCEYENGDHCIPWIRPYPPQDPATVPEAWPRI